MVIKPLVPLGTNFNFKVVAPFDGWKFKNSPIQSLVE